MKCARINSGTSPEKKAISFCLKEKFVFVVFIKSYKKITFNLSDRSNDSRFFTMSAASPI